MFWLLVQGERNYRAQPMSKERRIPAFFRLRVCFSKFDTRWIVGRVTGVEENLDRLRLLRTALVFLYLLALSAQIIYLLILASFFVIYAS